MFRYFAEFISDADARQEYAGKSWDAYKEAMELAEENMPVTHPIRLGVALNLSVFYYEIREDADKACEIAKKAFDSAITDLDDLAEDAYRDTTVIIAMLKENLTLWTNSE